MKTKIIYISGGETFEMTQIRAAFEEVRATLGLDSDTVLFGVPVDCDNALSNTVADDSADIVTSVIAETEIETVVDQEIIPTPIVSEFSADVIPETAIVAEAEELLKNESAVVQTVVDEVIAEPVAEETPVVADDDKVIPILSILASKSDVAKTDPVSEGAVGADEVATDTVVEEPVVAPVNSDVGSDEEVVISDISLDTQLVAPVSESAEDVEKITIGDMIEDEAPIAPIEKTLEQLLESMTPLREDAHTDEVAPVADEVMTDMSDVTDSDTDATLAQLASEFVQNEDKIISKPKSESQGKIGKLKNILPFKKAKRDDSSLMGDLFGWAGIAANDDDFSMPGFFTNARKQGA